jgi:hypothetical protein
MLDLKRSPSLASVTALELGPSSEGIECLHEAREHAEHLLIVELAR